MEDLRCNSLSCRKQLNNTAVVTTCSHIFCPECANALFHGGGGVAHVCPACSTELPETDDVVLASLNPPNAYKTSVLSGLHPSIIFEICSRALNFYIYQTSQEAAFQGLITRKAQERIAVLESQCSNLIQEATNEINLLKEKVRVTENDLEQERRKVRDLLETHKANSRSYAKLRAQLDKANKRNLLGPAAFEGQQQQQPPIQPFPPSSSGGPAQHGPFTGGTPLNSDRHIGSGNNGGHGQPLGQGWVPSSVARAGGGDQRGNVAGGSTRPRQSLQLDKPLQRQQQQIHMNVGGGGGGGGGDVQPKGFAGGFFAGIQGFLGGQPGAMPKAGDGTIHGQGQGQGQSKGYLNGNAGARKRAGSAGSGGSDGHGHQHGFAAAAATMNQKSVQGRSGFRPAGG
ncbi:hypothetical protein T439DRAFT_320698 [Meredithblackwellia eburnea MCA 4105]